MAEVLPINGLHFRLGDAGVGAADDVLAPPYDVLDDAGRQELLDRSPYNAVAVDLPVPPEGEPGDRYAWAAKLLADWEREGKLERDDEPAIWVLTQDYVGPDGEKHTRHGFLARVRVTHYGAGLVRPHERTQPGPKEDRLKLTRATKFNLSPIFSLYTGNAWPILQPFLDSDPWATATDADGTVNRIWKVTDREVHDEITRALAPSELLIADGHHRYETSRIYAEEIGGDGDHRYTLMCLVSLEDPGLTVYGTHRLIGGLAADPERQEALGKAVRDLFTIDVVDAEHLDPTGTDGVGVFGYVNARTGGMYRLTLKDPAILDLILGEARSEAYRRLDAVLIEELIFKGALGMSAADVEAKQGIGYAKSINEVLAKTSEDGPFEAAFILRPTPVDQVQSVADAGETMPPKSTFFFPKVPTGIVFNPLG